MVGLCWSCCVLDESKRLKGVSSLLASLYSQMVSLVSPFANTLREYFSLRDRDKITHHRRKGQFIFLQGESRELDEFFFKFNYENIQFPVTHPVSCNFSLLKEDEEQVYDRTCS